MKEKTDLRPKRIPSLDGFRGVSIWFVLMAHATTRFAPSIPHVIRSLIRDLGYFGVTIFFVISGFLITLLLLKERTRSSTISLPRFYKRRAARILPAFLLYVGVMVIFGHPTLVQTLYAFTFTTSFFFDRAYLLLQQLWSLSVEEVFYLLWPIVLARLPTRARSCCWAVMLLCPLLRVLLKHIGYQHYEHVAPSILDSIGAGCLLALYQERARTLARRYLCSTPAFVGLCLFSLVFAMGIYHLGWVILWGGVPALVALVIAVAIDRDDFILNRGPLVWSGLLSYSIYLWQQPLLLLPGPLNYLSIRLPLVFVAGIVSYRFVEQPVLRAFTPLAQPVRAHATGVGRGAMAG